MTHTDPPTKPPVQEPREAAESRASAEPATPDLRAVPWRAFLGYFVGLGSWGFGGPIATVGYMQRDLAERRRWLTRQDFLDGVALRQTMPGPLAAQVVMWLGFLRAGVRGCPAQTWISASCPAQPETGGPTCHPRDPCEEAGLLRVACRS